VAAWGEGHFRNDAMQLFYHPVLICMNFSFYFLKVITDQQWPTPPSFVVNINPPFGRFTAPLCHIFLIHNVNINSNNLSVNIRWTFTFYVEKTYDGMPPQIWWVFGLALPFQTRLTKRKWVLPLPNEHGSQVRDKGRRHCCHTKHKKFHYWPTHNVSLLSGHTSFLSLSLILIPQESAYLTFPLDTQVSEQS
jgi:hypothetical protein